MSEKKEIRKIQKEIDLAKLEILKYKMKIAEKILEKYL